MEEMHNVVFIKTFKELRKIFKHGGLNGYPVEWSFCRVELIRKYLDKIEQNLKNKNLPYICFTWLEPMDPYDYFINGMDYYREVIFHKDVEYLFLTKYHKELDDCLNPEKNKPLIFWSSFCKLYSVVDYIECEFIVRRKSWPEYKYLIFMRERKPVIKEETPYAKKLTRKRITMVKRFDLVENKQIQPGWVPSYVDFSADDWEIVFFDENNTEKRILLDVVFEKINKGEKIEL